MEPLTHSDILAFNQAVAELYALKETKGFHRRALIIISDLITCDRASYNKFDADGRIDALIHKSDEDQADAIALKGPLQTFVHEHPFWNYRSTVKTLPEMISEKDFHKMGLYNEFYKKLGTETQIVCDLPTTSGMREVYALSRGAFNYSEHEKLLLSLLRPHLANCFRSAAEAERFIEEIALLRIAAEAEDRGVILLTPQGGVKWMSRQARYWLYEYFGAPMKEQDRLPPALADWTAREIGCAVLKPERQPFIAEHSPPYNGRARQCLRVELVLGSEHPPPGEEEAAGFMLIMTERRCTLVETYGLTPREAEVLRYVAAGKTNADIALILNMGRRTAETHVARILTKLGVETRAAAAAMASNS